MFGSCFGQSCATPSTKTWRKLGQDLTIHCEPFLAVGTGVHAWSSAWSSGGSGESLFEVLGLEQGNAGPYSEEDELLPAVAWMQREVFLWLFLKRRFCEHLISEAGCSDGN